MRIKKSNLPSSTFLLAAWLVSPAAWCDDKPAPLAQDDGGSNAPISNSNKRPNPGNRLDVPLPVEQRPRILMVKPVILCDDDGSHPAPHVLPKRLVDQVYTNAGVEFIYLEPTRWNHGKARRGEVDLERIVTEGRLQTGQRSSPISRDATVVTLLFVSAVDGKPGPLGRGQQNGNVCVVALGAEGKDLNPEILAFVVAHEIGHCLNLKHVVDDPDVPDDVPNLQGEGTYAERLAIAGLHDTQKNTVLQSPLVIDRVRFLSIDEGRQRLVDESWEPYITAAHDDMLRFAIGLKVVDPIPADPRKRLLFGQQMFSEKVLEFSDDERALLSRLIARLDSLCGKDWPSVSRLPWHFIKVDSSFCRGMAHTRGRSIVLSQRNLQRIAVSEASGLKLLLHEKLHVIQRLHGTRFTALFEDYGFRRVQLAEGESQRLKLSQNPDALNLDWAIAIGDARSAVLTLLVPGRNGEIGFAMEYRQLDLLDDGTFTIGDVINRGEDFQDWQSGFPTRSGQDHPHEVSAYLSGFLLDADFLKTDNRVLDQRHLKTLELTRQAFRDAMRLDGS